MTRTECAGCAAPIVPNAHRHGRAAGVRVHQGRGLCEQCYLVEGQAGMLVNYPRVSRPAGDVLDEFVFLREQAGVSDVDMPARLRMTREAFERCLSRARVRGDARASGYSRVRRLA